MLSRTDETCQISALSVMTERVQKSPVPTGIRAPQGEDWFEISWQSGVKHRIPNLILRGYCPCARCQGHSGPICFVAGHDHSLDQIEQVGNYALKLGWGDGHSSGIYSFPHLYKLGELYAEHGDRLPDVLPELPTN